MPLYSGSVCPPGQPNTRRTPYLISRSTNCCPVCIDAPLVDDMRGLPLREGATDRQVDQDWVIGGQRRGDDSTELVGSSDPVGFDSEAACDGDEVDLGIDEIHADEAFGGFGGRALAPCVLLEDAIAPVVEDDPRDGETLVGGRPQRRDRVDGRAVADEGDDG